MSTTQPGAPSAATETVEELEFALSQVQTAALLIDPADETHERRAYAFAVGRALAAYRDELTRLRTALEERDAALVEAQGVILIAASLMDEVEQVHSLTGGGFRDALRVQMVRIAAEDVRAALTREEAPRGSDR